MTQGGDDPRLADLADGSLSGPEWDEWLAAHPDLAVEVALARRVSTLLAELRAMSVELPPDFEALLMDRIRRDVTILELLDLWLAGFTRVLVELLGIIFGARSAREPAP